MEFSRYSFTFLVLFFEYNLLYIDDINDFKSLGKNHRTLEGIIIKNNQEKLSSTQGSGKGIAPLCTMVYGTFKDFFVNLMCEWGLFVVFLMVFICDLQEICPKQNFRSLCKRSERKSHQRSVGGGRQEEVHASGRNFGNTYQVWEYKIVDDPSIDQ